MPGGFNRGVGAGARLSKCRISEHNVVQTYCKAPLPRLVMVLQHHQSGLIPQNGHGDCSIAHPFKTPELHTEYTSYDRRCITHTEDDGLSISVDATYGYCELGARASLFRL